MTYVVGLRTPRPKKKVYKGSLTGLEVKAVVVFK